MASSEFIKYLGVFRLEGNFFVAKRNISYFSFFTNEVRGHSITTWARKEGEWVSRKSTLGHVTKGRNHVNCPQFFVCSGGGFRRPLEEGWGSKLGRNWSTQLSNDS